MLETRKAQELDVVELTEDLPEYGLKRGQRGAVITAFDDPREAYDLEFVDESGESRFAYSVRPEQIKTQNEIAKDIFEEGVRLHNEGKPLEAEGNFRQAINLNPIYIRVLHNSVVMSLGGVDEWERARGAMRLILRINPNYKPARDNLAIAYLNRGVEEANNGDIRFSIEIFYRALGVATSPELVSGIRRNLAASYTFEGIKAHEAGAFIDAIRWMSFALDSNPDEKTRNNLAKAHARLAYQRLDEEDFGQAIVHFEYAEDFGLIGPELLNDYAIALAHCGRFDEAIIEMERALELAPNSMAILDNLQRVRNQIASELNVENIDIAFAPFPALEQRSYQPVA